MANTDNADGIKADQLQAGVQELLRLWIAEDARQRVAAPARVAARTEVRRWGDAPASLLRYFVRDRKGKP